VQVRSLEVQPYAGAVHLMDASHGLPQPFSLTLFNLLEVIYTPIANTFRLKTTAIPLIST
jgi:hypothetical protein